MAEEPSWGKMFSSWLREASLLMNLFVKGSGERCLSKAWLSKRSERTQLILMNLFVKSAFSTSVFTGGESSISSRRKKAGSENRPERSEHAAGLLTSSGLFSLTVLGC